MKKWFKRITAGAVAAVVFGMALMPQGESRAAAARIQVSVPENRVPAYEQGETKTFVLEVKNNGPDELKNIKAVPRLEGEEGQWPFATDYQSYAGLLRIYSQRGCRSGAVQGGLRRVRHRVRWGGHRRQQLLLRKCYCKREREGA